MNEQGMLKMFQTQNFADCIPSKHTHIHMRTRKVDDNLSFAIMNTFSSKPEEFASIVRISPLCELKGHHERNVFHLLCVVLEIIGGFHHQRKN